MTIGKSVWVAVASLAVAWEVVTVASRGRLPTFADVIATVDKCTFTRWFLIGLWGLLGWHIFIGFP